MTFNRSDLDQAARYIRYACELLEREAPGKTAILRAYRMGSRPCRHFTRERAECESRIYAAIVQKRSYTVVASARYCMSYPDERSQATGGNVLTWTRPTTPPSSPTLPAPYCYGVGCRS